MQHITKFAEYATIHFDAVRNTYNLFTKTVNFPKNKPFSVMDIGSGSGRLLREITCPLLPENCSEVVGIDRDPLMVEYCNSLNLDSKISFQQLDITTPELPEIFKDHFDITFATFCFHYMMNLRPALENCNKLLKPNGELLATFVYKRFDLYSTYRKMSEIDIWRPYTAEYANYVPHFSSEDPDSELKKIFNGTGLKLLRYKFTTDQTMVSKVKQYLEIFKFMDFIYRNIPEEKKKQYTEDFERLFCEVADFDFKNEQTINDTVEWVHPIVTIHAKKQI